MIWAEGWADPLVPVSDGMGDTRDLAVELAGTVANASLILTVAGVVIGLILFGIGSVLKRPHWAMRGVGAVIGSGASALVLTGMNAWIVFAGGEAIQMWY